MKMGTIRSPWRYDCTAAFVIESAETSHLRLSCYVYGIHTKVSSSGRMDAPLFRNPPFTTCAAIAPAFARFPPARLGTPILLPPATTSTHPPRPPTPSTPP